MDKKLIISLLVYLLVCILITSVIAGSKLDDYNFQYTKYIEDYQEFSIARDKYIQYKTLTAKDEAVTATQKLISQRNKTIKAHLLLLEDRLRTTPAVVGLEQKSKLISLLDREVNWLTAQDEELNNLSNPTLEDLFIFSDRVENKEKDFKSLAYQSLVAVILGKVRNSQSESVVITNLLANKVGSLEASRAAELNDWLQELENKNYLSQKEIELAEERQEKLAKERYENRMQSIYIEIKRYLGNANNYLKQAMLFQEEIYSALEKIELLEPVISTEAGVKE